MLARTKPKDASFACRAGPAGPAFGETPFNRIPAEVGAFLALGAAAQLSAAGHAAVVGLLPALYGAVRGWRAHPVGGSPGNGAVVLQRYRRFLVGLGPAGRPWARRLDGAG